MKITFLKEETENTLKVTVEWEKPKIDYDKFTIVCWLIGIFMVGSGFIKFFSMMM